MPGEEGEAAVLRHVVETLDMLEAPFEDQVLSVARDAVKLEVTPKTAGVQTGYSVRSRREDAQDTLGKVFCQVATHVLPWDFNFRGCRRLLLEGEALSGKSTLLKHLAVLCATHQTTCKPGAAIRSSSPTFLPLVLSGAELDSFSQKRGFSENDDILEDFLAEKLRYNHSILRTTLNALRRGWVWVLIDNFDVLDSHFQAVLLQYLEHKMNRYIGARVILSSLPLDEPDAPALLAQLGYQGLVIRPPTVKVAKRLVESAFSRKGDTRCLENGCIPNWLHSSLCRPSHQMFRRNPWTVLLFVKILNELDQESRTAPGLRWVPPHLSFEHDPNFYCVDFATPETDELHKRVQINCLLPPFSTEELMRRAALNLVVLGMHPSYLTMTGLRHENAGISKWISPVPLYSTARYGPTSSLMAIQQVLQVLAYSTHVKNSRYFRVNEIWEIAEALAASFNLPLQDIKSLMIRLISRIQAGQNPLFMLQDRVDFIVEQTPAQLLQQKLRRFHEEDNQCRDKFPGKAIFVHQTIQEHFCAEHIANTILQVIAGESGAQALGMRPRSRSVVIPTWARAGGERTYSPRHARRGSALGSCMPPSVDYTQEQLQSNLKEVVELVFLGHPEPSAYRIGKRWWQPVILLCFEILERCAPQNTSDTGPSLCELLLQLIVDIGGRLISRVDTSSGRQINVLQTFFHAAVAHGNLMVVSSLLKLLGATFLLKVSNEDGNNALHLAAVNNQPQIVELLMKETGVVDAEYLDSNNQYGWDPSNMAMVFNYTQCFRLLCRTDGDQEAKACSMKSRPKIVHAAMYGDIKCIDRLLQLLAIGEAREQGHLTYRAAFKPRNLRKKKAQSIAKQVRDFEETPITLQTDLEDVAMVSFDVMIDKLELELEFETKCTEVQGVAQVTARNSGSKGTKEQHQSTRNVVVGLEDEALFVFDSSDPEACKANAFYYTFGDPVQVNGGEPKQEHLDLLKNLSLSDIIITSVAFPKASKQNRENSPLNRTSASTYNLMNTPNSSAIKRNSIEPPKECIKDPRTSPRPQGKNSINLNATGSSGMTACMWAARNGHSEILDKLIRHGADIHRSINNCTALLFAIDGGHTECVRLLLEAGADPLTLTIDDDSCLLCACSFGFDEISHLLIEAGACALEALVIMCVQGRTKSIQALLETQTVDVNAVWDDLMVSPLAGACVAGHHSTVNLLLSFGADPNAVIDAEFGSTPLMLACHMGNLDVIKSMLDAGADVNARAPASSQCAIINEAEYTACAVAKKLGHVEVERFLRERGGSLYVPTDLSMYEWLGGHVQYPLMSADFSKRRKIGVAVDTLLDDDDYFSRIDLLLWQWLGGRTEGERAWEPRP